MNSMKGMFAGCSALKSVATGNFDTASVRDMSQMFSGCFNLATIDLSRFDTSSVRDMSQMFRDCFNLTSIDLSHFDTSSVQSLDGLADMFAGCSGATVTVVPGSSIEKQANMSEVTVVRATESSNDSRGQTEVSGMSDMERQMMSQYTNVSESKTSVDPVRRIEVLKTKNGRTTYECEVQGFGLFLIDIECDRDGKIVSVTVPQHSEPIGRYVIENEGIMNRLVGQSASEAQIDVMSGATLTCEAINKAIQRVGSNYSRVYTGESGTAVVIREGVTANIREEPGMDTRRIGQAKSGATYRLLESLTKDDITWYKVDLGNGKVGYIHSKMAELK
ncbi:MAG: BspA family leucine-rich repeat surface protein [Clostridia bacterium]|nr:BspA family leucine-rich repeat surface protein [Clostridia bacterium]